MSKMDRDGVARLRRALFIAGVVFGATAALQGCNSDCGGEYERARQFVENPANLSCQTDNDCVVVGTGCQQFQRGVCNQIGLNRSAAASSKWRQLNQELSDCQGDDCTHCAAALILHCNQGQCLPQ
ncbi:MAG: hypothetical protein ABUL62_27815 [Myxococcales bacterium]